MIECNQFEASVFLEGGTVSWALETDLPTKSIVMIEGIRFIENPAGRKFEWTIYEDRFFIEMKNEGTHGSSGLFEIEPNEAEAIESLKKITHDSDWGGMRVPEGNELLLRFTLAPYQRERIDEFGDRNVYLKGDETITSGGRSHLAKEVALKTLKPFSLENKSRSQQIGGHNSGGCTPSA